MALTANFLVGIAKISQKLSRDTRKIYINNIVHTKLRLEVLF